jgi:hypothetical protein
VAWAVMVVTPHGGKYPPGVDPPGRNKKPPAGGVSSRPVSDTQAGAAGGTCSATLPGSWSQVERRNVLMTIQVVIMATGLLGVGLLDA